MILFKLLQAVQVGLVIQQTTSLDNENHQTSNRVVLLRF
jgi:hypothetical protein